MVCFAFGCVGLPDFVCAAPQKRDLKTRESCQRFARFVARNGERAKNRKMIRQSKLRPVEANEFAARKIVGLRRRATIWDGKNRCSF